MGPDGHREARLTQSVVHKVNWGESLQFKHTSLLKATRLILGSLTTSIKWAWILSEFTSSSTKQATSRSRNATVRTQVGWSFPMRQSNIFRIELGHWITYLNPSWLRTLTKSMWEVAHLMHHLDHTRVCHSIFSIPCQGELEKVDLLRSVCVKVGANK